LRDQLRWRLPGFKEAALAQLASAIALMLRSGIGLADALALTEQMERRTAAGADLRRWLSRLEEGHGKFAQLAASSKVFPPLFLWSVHTGGEDLAGGFGSAAMIYQRRALHKIDILLYAALPVSVILLGVLILGQLYPAFQILLKIIQGLDSTGSME